MGVHIIRTIVFWGLYWGPPILIFHGWLDGWLVGCLLAWLVGWLVGCLLACLVGWLVGWLVEGHQCFSPGQWQSSLGFRLSGSYSYSEKPHGKNMKHEMDTGLT